MRLRDADVLVLIRERTQFPRQLLEKLPKLKLISQTGRVGSHIDVETCTRLGIAVAEGVGSPVAPAELTWALIMASMRRLPQYIGNLKHGAWQQSGLQGGLDAAELRHRHGAARQDARHLGLRQDRPAAWPATAAPSACRCMVWGSEASRERAAAAGLATAPDKDTFFETSDVLSLHLRLVDEHARHRHARGPVAHEAAPRCSSTPRAPNCWPRTRWSRR